MLYLVVPLIKIVIVKKPQKTCVLLVTVIITSGNLSPLTQKAAENLEGSKHFRVTKISVAK